VCAMNSMRLSSTPMPHTHTHIHTVCDDIMVRVSEVGIYVSFEAIDVIIYVFFAGRQVFWAVEEGSITGNRALLQMIEIFRGRSGSLREDGALLQEDRALLRENGALTCAAIHTSRSQSRKARSAVRSAKCERSAAISTASALRCSC